MGEHVLGVDGVGGSSPPASTKLVASCSYLVKAKQTLISIKGNRKKDIRELKKEERK